MNLVARYPPWVSLTRAKRGSDVEDDILDLEEVHWDEDYLYLQWIRTNMKDDKMRGDPSYFLRNSTNSHEEYAGLSDLLEIENNKLCLL
jgi:hypothetical protein